MERKFGVEFPDSIWTDRGELSPEGFVGIIIELQESSAVRAAPRSSSREENVGTAIDSRFERMRAAIFGRGMLSGTKWIAGRIAARVAAVVFARDEHVILARDLADGGFTGSPRPTDLTFKEIFLEELRALEELWAPHYQPQMMKHLSRRLGWGFLCLAAWRGEEVVGIDYLSLTGDYDKDTGLRIITLPGTCYGLDLHEKYPGQGIGMALLDYSLRETLRRGLKRQVTFVRKKNTLMLATSGQVYGFRKIGEISTTRWFGIPRSTWTLGSTSGKGHIIEI
jgi:GNAT superfamily N-acetyltransferase